VAEKPKILLGVTGGIAAYKVVGLASQLCADGANVKTVMTHNATQLVGPMSFEAVTHGPVHTDLWEDVTEDSVEHIDLVEWADIVVVAPATANIIGKIAHAICDDLLSTILCACWKKPVLIAPAMNVNMWDNPAVQKNIETISSMRFAIVGPQEGPLACGVVGMGRMAEPEQIQAAIGQIVAKT